MDKSASTDIPKSEHNKMESEFSREYTSFSGNTQATKVPDYVRVLLITDLNGRKRKLYIPAALDLDRPKRPRTIFSAQQLQILEAEFQANHFVTESRRMALSRALKLSETQIKVWFQNRRTKLRRDSSEESCSSKIFSWDVNVNVDKQA